MKKNFLVLSLLFFLSIFTVSKAQISWSMFHGCERHCGLYPAREYQEFDQIKWQFKTEGRIFGSPAIYNQTAYIGSEDKNLYAINLEDGSLKWKFPTKGAIHSSPAYYKDVVYFGSFDGHYYAVDAATGKEKWKFKTGGEKWMGGVGYWGMQPVEAYHEDLWDFYLSSPIINMEDDDLIVYFGSSDGNLYAVDAASGKLKWKFKTQSVIHSSPALYEGKVYIGSWDSNLYALEAKTGELLWKFETGTVLGMNGIQASPSVDAGKVYFGARDANFYALDANTGEMIWKYDAENTWVLSSAAVKDGTVYFGTSDTYLFVAVDAQTGKEKYRFKANGYVFTSPSIAGNTAFFGDFTGKLFAMDLTSEGKKWDEFEIDTRKENAQKVLTPNGNMDFGYLLGEKDFQTYNNNLEVMNQLYTLGPVVSSPAIGDGTIYFGSADGNFYALALKTERLEAAP